MLLLSHLTDAPDIKHAGNTNQIWTKFDGKDSARNTTPAGNNNKPGVS
jgi:hypothetical protein